MQIKYNIKSLKNTDAFDGKWYKYDDGFVRITILRDLLSITSPIATKPVNVDLNLPSHPAFYLDIVSINSSRRVKIGENRGFSFKVAKGESLRGFVGLK